MGQRRYKTIAREEFSGIADRNWAPVILVGEMLPRWMRGIPEDKIALVLASGTFIDPRIIEEDGINLSGVVGGIDLYRRDEKDVARGFPFNKDHYIVVRHSYRDELLLIAGPFKKSDDHWFEVLPRLDPEIEILEFRGTIIDKKGE